MPYQWDVPDLCMDEWGFRAIYSEKLVAQICTAFNLGILNIAYDLGGSYNLNVFLSTSTGEYVLRVYRPWITFQRLRTIQETKKALAQRGLPIPQPVATAASETITILEGRLAEVERFVIYDHTTNSFESYAKGFALLGFLHNALKVSVPSQFIPPRVSNYGTPSQLFRWILRTERFLQKKGGLSEQAQAFKTCQEARDVLCIIDKHWQQVVHLLPTQLIHGDYKGKNILFQGNNIVAVVDFEFLGIRERIFELAYTTFWFLRKLERGTPLDKYPWGEVASFLKIYNHSSSRPLTQLELETFPFELARVPLYWITNANYTFDPLLTLQSMASSLTFSRWLLDHAHFIGNQLMR